MNTIEIISSLFQADADIKGIKKRFGNSALAIPVLRNTLDVLIIRGFLEDYTSKENRDVVIVSFDRIIEHLRKYDKNVRVHYLHLSKDRIEKMIRYVHLYPETYYQDILPCFVNVYNPTIVNEVFNLSLIDYTNRFFRDCYAGEKLYFRTWNVYVDEKGLINDDKVALLGTNSEICKETYPIFWKLLSKELEKIGYKPLFVVKENEDYYLSPYYMDSLNLSSVRKRKTNIGGFLEQAGRSSIYIGCFSSISVLVNNMGVRCVSLYPSRCKQYRYGIRSYDLGSASLYDVANKDDYACIEMPWLRSMTNPDHEEDRFYNRIEQNREFSERLMSLING